MESFAGLVKRLRKEKGVPLRIVAAYLDIDQAILSKIENGKRLASRENVSKFASYYTVNEDELVISWLSDKLLYEVAEEKLAYKLNPHVSKEKIIEIIQDFFSKDGRVAKAWIFGSFARGDNNTKSDLDLMVRFKDSTKTSLFDYADIAYLLEQQTKIKIDLVEEGYLRPFALETAKKDLKLIYG
jgi:predicted nucleotidyltransferase